jgi:hypothetical protein
MVLCSCFNIDAAFSSFALFVSQIAAYQCFDITEDVVIVTIKMLGLLEIIQSSLHSSRSFIYTQFPSIFLLANKLRNFSHLQSEGMVQEHEVPIKQTHLLWQQNQALIQQNQALTQQNQALTQQNQTLTQQNQTLTQQNQALIEQHELEAQALHQQNQALIEQHQSEAQALHQQNQALIQQHQSEVQRRVQLEQKILEIAEWIKVLPAKN